MYGEWQNCITESWYTFQYEKLYFGQLITSQTFNLIIGHLHDGAILVHTF